MPDYVPVDELQPLKPQNSYALSKVVCEELARHMNRLHSMPIIAAADTIMNRPNSELMEAVFPGVPIKEGTGDFETLLSIGKARKMLGFEPQYSWRDLVKER